jgi:hypothetical protein
MLACANHTHDHDGLDNSCAACMCMQAAANLLNNLSLAAVTFAAVFCGLCGIFFSSGTSATRFNLLTLASLKIRLNN